MRGRGEDCVLAPDAARTVLILLLASGVLAPIGAAQEPDENGNVVRPVVGAGLGLGWSVLGSSHRDVFETYQRGRAAHLRVGAALDPRWLASVEGSWWRRVADPWTRTQANLNAVAYFYPSGPNGLFLKAGVGVATLTLDVEGLDRQSETGFGWVVGVGHHWRIGSIRVGPYAHLVHARFQGGQPQVAGLGVDLTIG